MAYKFDKVPNKTLSILFYYKFRKVEKQMNV